MGGEKPMVDYNTVRFWSDHVGYLVAELDGRGKMYLAFSERKGDMEDARRASLQLAHWYFLQVIQLNMWVSKAWSEFFYELESKTSAPQL